MILVLVLNTTDRMRDVSTLQTDLQEADHLFDEEERAARLQRQSPVAVDPFQYSRTPDFCFL